MPDDRDARHAEAKRPRRQGLYPVFRIGPQIGPVKIKEDTVRVVFTAFQSTNRSGIGPPAAFDILRLKILLLLFDPTVEADLRCRRDFR